eukprot:6197055-Pleurochrysis_carterae.AAC.1
MEYNVDSVRVVNVHRAQMRRNAATRRITQPRAEAQTNACVVAAAAASRRPTQVVGARSSSLFAQTALCPVDAGILMGLLKVEVPAEGRPGTMVEAREGSVEGMGEGILIIIIEVEELRVGLTDLIDADLEQLAA